MIISKNFVLLSLVLISLLKYSECACVYKEKKIQKARELEKGIDQNCRVQFKDFLIAHNKEGMINEGYNYAVWSFTKHEVGETVAKIVSVNANQLKFYIFCCDDTGDLKVVKGRRTLLI